MVARNRGPRDRCRSTAGRKLRQAAAANNTKRDNQTSECGTASTNSMVKFQPNAMVPAAIERWLSRRRDRERSLSSRNTKIPNSRAPMEWPSVFTSKGS